MNALKAENEVLQQQRISLEKQLSGADTKKNELRTLEDQLSRMDTLAEVERLQRELNALRTRMTVEGVGDQAELRAKVFFVLFLILFILLILNE